MEMYWLHRLARLTFSIPCHHLFLENFSKTSIARLTSNPQDKSWEKLQILQHLSCLFKYEFCGLCYTAWEMSPPSICPTAAWATCPSLTGIHPHSCLCVPRMVPLLWVAYLLCNKTFPGKTPHTSTHPRKGVIDQGTDTAKVQLGEPWVLLELATGAEMTQKQLIHRDPAQHVWQPTKLGTWRALSSLQVAQHVERALRKGLRWPLQATGRLSDSSLVRSFTPLRTLSFYCLLQQGRA